MHRVQKKLTIKIDSNNLGSNAIVSIGMMSYSLILRA